MGKKIEQYYVVIHLLVLLLLVSFVFIAVPTTDDYAFCVSSRANSIWESVVKMFSGWGGRYAQAFVAAVWYKFEELTHVPYAVGLLLFMLVLFAGIYSFLGIFITGKNTGKSRMLLATVFCAGIFRGLPTLDESIYWNIGGITYLLPTALFLYFLAVLQRSRLSGRVWQAQPLLIVLILFTGGINEAFVVFNILVVLGLLIYQHLSGKQNKVYYITLAAALLGLAVISSSSGNTVRMQFYPQSGQFLYSLFWGSITGTQAVIQAVADPYIWGSVLLFFPFLQQIRNRLTPGILSGKALAVFIVTFVIMLYSVVAIHYYATGNRPVQRLMVIWYIVFYLGIFSLAVRFSPELGRVYDYLAKIVGKLLKGKVSPRIILAVVVFASFLLINNPPKAVYDLIYNVPGFLKENRAFLESARELQQSDVSPKVFVVEKFRNRPVLLKAPTDADYGMTTYFGFDRVEIVDHK